LFARFGGFEVDMEQGTVLRNGVPIALQEKPLQLLLALLEKPGRIVTRAELRDCLWPADFVSFDDGLNTAVRKLRQALDDSAESARFVETIPKRVTGSSAPSSLDSGPHWVLNLNADPILAAAYRSTHRVISRTSAMHYRDRNLTVTQIAEQLGVDAVVEGSVTRSGNHAS
jgi:hypothetical protein